MIFLFCYIYCCCSCLFFITSITIILTWIVFTLLMLTKLCVFNSNASLGFLTINNALHGHQLSSTCNLSSLEVDINVSVSPCSPFFKSLLHVLSNVNKMTLSWRTLRMMLFLSFILYVLSFSVYV